ncbi:MAG: hypothetical protein FK734_03670 [Asgard group archaeon]|nr:hypothetical protein [Asgard group archaeon]
MDIIDDFLFGGDELFDNPRFVKHFTFMLNDYQTPNKPIAFFLSCSKYKPYYKSPYRRVFNAMIEKKIVIREISHYYTISEPAIIIPEELDDTKVTHYDFPPEKMEEKGKRVFIERLTILLPKIIDAHELSFYILPKHHRGIFEKAMENIIESNTKKYSNITSKVIYAPPLTYNLPKAKEIIIQKLVEAKLLEAIH